MNFSRLFSDSLKSIRRHLLMSLASILVMFLTVFCSSVLAILVWSLGNLLNFVESQAQMSVFFTDVASPEDAQNFGQALSQSRQLVSVEYVSKEKALQIYTQQYQNEPLLTESVTAEIFPASLDVRAKNIAVLTALSDFLKEEEPSTDQISSTALALETSPDMLNYLLENRQFIEEVVFYKDIASQISVWLKAARFGGLALVAFLIFVSLLVVLVTVGLNVRSDRDEISILKLVGATDSYVQFPYLMQGGLLGIFGALLSITTLAIASPWVVSYLAPLWRELSWQAPSWWLVATFGFGQLLIGGFVGCFGSWLAAMRYSRP